MPVLPCDDPVADEVDGRLEDVESERVEVDGLEVVVELDGEVVEELYGEVVERSLSEVLLLELWPDEDEGRVELELELV